MLTPERLSELRAAVESFEPYTTGSEVVAGLEELLDAIRPIPVSERLPEHGRRVLAFYDSNAFGYDDFCVAWFTAAITSNGVWVDIDRPTHLATEQFVTHWLPLPPAPDR